MNTYLIKPAKSLNYFHLISGLFFLIAAIGTLYVLIVLVPADSNLPKSTYFVVLFFLAIAGFSFYKMKQQSNLSSYTLNVDGITNIQTGQTILWKNLGDLYFFSSGKVVGLANNLAFRTSENESFTTISAMQYNIKDLETIESIHLKPRTEKVLENIRNGKTETFYSLKNNTLNNAFNISESQFLKFDSDKILLKHKELIYKDKAYPLTDLSVIGLSNSGEYQLKTKEGNSILEFNKLNLISCEVFRNVMNDLVTKINGNN